MALSLNADKRLQSTDSIETYTHGMSKDLIWKKEKTERINIIKQYKKWLILMMLSKKTSKEHQPIMTPSSWSFL